MAPAQGQRAASFSRETKETSISVSVDIDGTGRFDISTGVGFFDHMLEQLSRHSLIDMTVKAEGDLHIDDHHTVEDTGIALGQAIAKALGERRGITRYASIDLAMDETLTRAAVDVSGRPFLVWNVEFSARQRSARSTPNWCASSSRRWRRMPASRCMSSISTAPTTITSPRPASRRWRGCCARRWSAIRARPTRSRRPKARCRARPMASWIVLESPRDGRCRRGGSPLYATAFPCWPSCFRRSGCFGIGCGSQAVVTFAVLLAVTALDGSRAWRWLHRWLSLLRFDLRRA